MDVFIPTTVPEALQPLGQLGPGAVIVGGGTNVLRDIQIGARKAQAIVYLGRVEALRAIEIRDRPTIGAAATHAKILREAALSPYSSLVSIAASVGGWQTQSVATLGGNVCNAHPGAEMAAALLVHNAVVTLESAARGRRRMPLAAFLLGPRRLNREADELLTSIDLDPMPEDAVDLSIKVRRRRSGDWGLLSVAVRFVVDGPRERLKDVRIAVAGAADSPFRARAAEAALEGERLTEALAVRAGAAVGAAAKPYDDIRASAVYRAAALPRVAAQALRLAHAAARRRSAA